MRSFHSNMDETALLSSVTFSTAGRYVTKAIMRGNFRRIFLNVFIMLAIIGAGISPACKFISGQQTWLEICGADGIKKVLLSADETPDAPQEEHANADPCAFCLTHASVKVIGTKAAVMPAPVLASAQYSFVESSATLASFYHPTAFPRGPPIVL